MSTSTDVGVCTKATPNEALINSVDNKTNLISIILAGIV
jgi:hypothetical protein